MADKQYRFEQNILGKYYVDDQCIACDACILAADGFFEMNDEEGHAFVKKQPQNQTEETECLDALEGCPVDAIGNDG